MIERYPLVMLRACKNSFYCLLICLNALFTAHASSSPGNELNYLNLKYPALVKSIYQNQPDKRFWNNSSLRYELEKQIQLFVLADLNDDLSDVYHSLRRAAQANNWRRYERLASDLLLFYLAYTEQVAVNGKDWLFGKGVENNIGRPSVSAIEKFFNNPSALARDKYLQSLSPSSMQYVKLYRKLSELYFTKNMATGKYTAFAKPGEQLLQKDILLSRLQSAGEISSKWKIFFESEDKKLYSQELQSVIVSFQKRHGLKPDGIIGENTRYWLNISHQERIRLMALNMLRLKLWPANQPQMILINIPGFDMEYWQDGEIIFNSKVIVGRTDRKTPLLSTRLDSIVFNPAWRVPTSIMRMDILPEALKHTSYFKRNGYEIVENWQSEKVINPNQIDWHSISINNFPYKLRQKPGKTNALGLYKFNTPNRYTIYLHDTPAKHLFSKQNRTFSSGCIRVQKAEQFMQLLMDRSGYPPEDYGKRKTEKKTSVAQLKKSIPVYTTYKTVWVDELGITQFRTDIYNYDQFNRSKNLAKNVYRHQQEKNLMSQLLN